MDNQKEPRVYDICIRERIDDECLDWFEGMQLTVLQDGTTMISGLVRDQSALLGLLNKVAALGLTLVSVHSCG